MTVANAVVLRPRLRKHKQDSPDRKIFLPLLHHPQHPPSTTIPATAILPDHSSPQLNYMRDITISLRITGILCGILCSRGLMSSHSIISRKGFRSEMLGLLFRKMAVFMSCSTYVCLRTRPSTSDMVYPRTLDPVCWKTTKLRYWPQEGLA